MGTSANSSTEQFNIRWKNYTSVLQSVFRDLLEEERLVDVTLACEGGFIKCHRIILSACSSYFENLLNELQSEPHLVIFMKDLKLWELQALIHFMYNGQVSVTQNRLAPLVRAAEALHIRGLSTESDEKQSPSSHLGIRRNSLDQDESFDSAPPQPQKKVIRRTPLGVANKPEQKPTVGGATSSSAAAPITQSVKRPSMSSNGGGSSGSSSGPPKLLKMRRIETPEASTSSWSPSSNLALQNKSSSSKLGSRRNTTELEESQSHRLNGEYEKGDEDMSKEEEDYNMDKLSESAECDGDPLGEGYSDEVDNTYDDGTLYSEQATSGQAYLLDARPIAARIADPPISGPVVDAADRANRLKKATDLALSGITVRQAAAHYGIPRTTLCAYMKRRGLSGKRLTNATGGSTFTYQNQYQQADPTAADEEDDETEFPFMGDLANLVKGQHYEIHQQENSC
ncbi:longitudinals lacking protein, isoforms H/M/V isoform X2 [Folsomia candida]|nr:longitudinals lacking protein, isoforms H/M/V isoform X2 [Folsomia candida]XP_021964052.1 longitudinals lacking protein, isoforms H/M/V isoform X2 [Folsomia candida]XP_021964053.1 longitudinals lacking protein, isoforms H/M/V isoform X2 [Folsomia candida]XP_035715212.1 longitudinals lacking protein, isoforms H/M/V isoform X2 [Folsomia candida]XP_035715213.1 longitudinals lacking protein, isoforms H/M/V isoform X2 [Folsomia candida]